MSSPPQTATALMLAMLCLAVVPPCADVARARRATPDSSAEGEDGDRDAEWVEFEDGHTGETVRAPAADQRDPEGEADPGDGEEPPPTPDQTDPPSDDVTPIATPRPTRWEPNRGRQCRRRRRHRFCDGPLRVPSPTGDDAVLARRLGLGLSAGQHLMSRPPRDEWTEAAEGRRFHSLRWPVDGGRLWRGVQPRRGRRPEHKGVDIGAEAGTLVLAANDGLVVYAHNGLTGYGNMVIIAHPDGTATFYAHLQAAYVFPGMQVRRAQVLGEVGDTGIAHGAHLHFEWRVGGYPSDPLSRFVRIPESTAARVAHVIEEG